MTRPEMAGTVRGYEALRSESFISLIVHKGIFLLSHILRILMHFLRENNESRYFDEFTRL